MTLCGEHPLFIPLDLFRGVCDMGGKIDGGHLWALKECLRRALNDMQGSELKEHVRRQYRSMCENFSVPDNLDSETIDAWVEEQWKLWARSLEKEQIE